MPANTVTLGTIAAEGVTADVWTMPDGTLNIDQLFAAAARGCSRGRTGRATGTGRDDGDCTREARRQPRTRAPKRPGP